MIEMEPLGGVIGLKFECMLHIDASSHGNWNPYILDSIWIS